MVQSKVILVGVLLMVFAGPLSAEASWVKPNKKRVFALEGFQNSANGAITNILPWNWVGRPKSDRRSKK